MDRVTLQELHALAKQGRSASKYYDYHDPAFFLTVDAGVVTVHRIADPRLEAKINPHDTSVEAFERTVFAVLSRLAVDDEQRELLD